MAWDADQTQYWKDVEKQLRALHGQDLFDAWSASPDEFVKDMLEFCQASYSAGHSDALYMAQRVLSRLELDE
jgi:hypothetical protein